MEDTLTLTANLDALAQISAFITDAAELAGLDERATWQVQLAVDEAATNVIQHAYDRENPGDLVVRWQCDDQRFVVVLRDYGRQFNPQNVPAPDIDTPLEERQVGGLGVYLITRLMDEVHFDFDPQQGNVLTMVKHITPDQNNTITVLPIIGRLDAMTAPQINEDVHQHISGGARRVVLDLSDVSFLSSSGLRSLLLIRKELMTLGGELRLAALQPQVQEVFALTGFTQVFAIHASVELAQSAFGQGRA